MDGKKIAKSTQEQAVAAWINFRNVLRLQELAERLSKQEFNFEQAMAEMQKLKVFVAHPEHIFGDYPQKHGEIAEHIQVRFSNAERLVRGLEANHTFEGVARTAAEDYLRDGKMVQSKFYKGVSGTLTAIANHHDKYPWFMQNGECYDIPKSQYEELMRIYASGQVGVDMDPSDAKLFEAIKEWENQNDVKFDEVVQPSLVNYEDVQLDTVDNTIRDEETHIEEIDQEQRDHAHAVTAPSLKEGAKVTITAALLEGGMAFTLGVYKKKKDGKKIVEFTQDDWKDLGFDSIVGAGKGAVRGGSVYVLTNFVSVPAPMASAMVTATIGMLSLAYGLNNADISAEEFVDASETMCLDVTVSAISSILGEILIPIPVLGAIIGNTAGMFMMNIARTYLSSTEQQFIAEYQKETASLIAKSDEDHMVIIKKLQSELDEYASLAFLAFDPDANIRLESIINRARLIGANTERLLNFDEGASLFTSGQPIVL